MKFHQKILVVIAFSITVANPLRAQLNITAVSTDYTIDFDNTLSGVNEGTYLGTGLAPIPSVGNLDGDAWEIVGFSSGTHNYGNTSTSGDFAKGTSTGGEFSGGLYSFEVSASDYTLGVQPTGSDFTPGEITLKITNNSGVALSAIQLDYELWVLNNAGRSNSFNLSYSLDNTTFTNVPAFDFTSPQNSDPSPVWNLNTMSSTITFASMLANSGTFYLRWSSQDNGGSGSRDEFALDDIVVNGAGASCAAPDIPSLSAGSLTICSGASETISINASDSLRDATQWMLYMDSCGGTKIDSNTTGTFTVSPTDTTTYYIRGEDGTGCVDESMGSCGSITINVLPIKTGSITQTLCAGDSIVVNGTTYNTTVTGATEVFTNVGPQNCDSTVTINLNVLPALTGAVNNTICNEDSIVVNGTTYNASNPTGTEIFTNIGTNNCDSTVTINLNVLSALTGAVSNTICNEDSIVVNGTTYNASNPTGTEIFTSIGANNCDSTVTINLNVLPALIGAVNNTICNEDSIVVNGTTYNASNPMGTQVFTNTGPNNCDSTVTINLAIQTIDRSINRTGDTLSSNENGATYQWINCVGNTPITGDTNQVFVATASGNYAVIVTNNGCSDTSTCFNVTITEVFENTLDNEFKIYPNPVKNQLAISFEERINDSYNISIRNSLCQIVREFNLNGQKVNVDLSDLDKGVYFINVSNSKGNKIVQLIKQ